MFVGIGRIVLQIPGARSLKDRRQVVKSFKDRVRARSNAAIAEVGELERYQVATLALAVVSGDRNHVEEQVDQVRKMASNLKDAWLADIAVEILSFGFGGSQLDCGIEQTLQRFDPGPIGDEEP